MKKAKPRSSGILERAGIVVAALALVAGSFAFASGSLLDGSGSLLAATLGMFGNQSIVITRAATSPSGTIPSGTNQNLATFNVQARGANWQGTIKKFTVSIPVSGTAAASLNVNSIAAHYRYCIPGGVTYGYGYNGGSCGTVNLTPDAATRSGNTYNVSFSQPVPVYPQQSYGALIVSGTPSYANSSVKGAAQLRADMTSVSASGVTCSIIHYGYKNKYAYSKCRPSEVSVITFGATGNMLTVKNPYGYATSKPITIPGLIRSSVMNVVK